MWISIVLIVLVIVVGLIAGTRLSTPGPQRRAVFSAFGALAVLAIWFFVFIAFFPADWIVPFFTVACIVIPICIYVGVSRGTRDKSMKIPKAKSVDTIKADQPLGPKPPTPEKATTKQSKPSTTPSTIAGSTKAPSVSAPPSVQPSRATTPAPSQASAVAPKPAPVAAPQKATEASKPKPKPETQPAKQPEVGAKAQEATPMTNRPMPASTSTPASRPSAEKPSTKDLEKDLISSTKPPAPEAVDPKIAAAADMDILVNKAVAEEIDELEELVKVKPFGDTPRSTTLADGPELNIGSPLGRTETTSQDAEPAHKPAAKPAEVAPASQPAPTPKKPAKPKSDAEAFAEFSTRAAALRDQGAYAIAAMLYEEAAAIAPNANASREAQFDGLSCYVKANDVKKAKEIAAKLRQSSVLTRFERIKLDAVERMG